jgi:hypothetical protein
MKGSIAVIRFGFFRTNLLIIRLLGGTIDPVECGYVTLRLVRGCGLSTFFDNTLGWVSSRCEAKRKS